MTHLKVSHAAFLLLMNFDELRNSWLWRLCPISKWKVQVFLTRSKKLLGTTFKAATVSELLYPYVYGALDPGFIILNI